MTREFIIMPEFDKKWKSLGFTDIELKALQEELTANPLLGKIMQGTGGLRKLRFAFENRGKMPTLVYKNEPEAKRMSQHVPMSKKAKLIYQFETTTPHDFLALKYGGIEPTKQDLMILEYLLVDLKLLWLQTKTILFQKLGRIYMIFF